MFQSESLYEKIAQRKLTPEDIKYITDQQRIYEVEEALTLYNASTHCYAIVDSTDCQHNKYSINCIDVSQKLVDKSKKRQPMTQSAAELLSKHTGDLYTVICERGGTYTYASVKIYTLQMLCDNFNLTESQVAKLFMPVKSIISIYDTRDKNSDSLWGVVEITHLPITTDASVKLHVTSLIEQHIINIELAKALAFS